MEKLTNIKIVFLDIDGTLTNSNKMITKETKKAIKSLIDRDIFVVLVTGRNCPYAVRVSKEVSSTPIVITSNGTEVFDYENNRLIYGDKIPKKSLEKLFEFCSENKIKIIINTISDVYVNNHMKDYSKEKVINTLKELNALEVIQIVLQLDKISDINKCKEIVSDCNLKINYLPNGFKEKEFNSFDVNNNNVSKKTAINYLLEELNIEKKDSLCFGDYINDKDMFDACGYKVAMGNATDAIKEIADFVTLSNDDNGVADFINKYL